MGYIEQTMLPGEQIIARTRLHWMIFIPPLLLFVSGVLSVASSHPAMIGVMFLVLIFCEILIYIVYKATELAVTNRRLIVKSGFLHRKSVELLPEKVESFHFDQSLYGRIFNYGTISVTGIGATKARYSFIAAPLFFYQKVHEVLMAHSQANRHH